ncbi:MAG: DUF493 domain-containing protein [Verrucomicrobiae bacterium]|nr:DUF493 domain-containing protein [Verrucomicrobiae bacterium]
MKTHELQFPLECHFRVIAECREGMRTEIEAVLRRLGIEAPVERGNVSGKGRYAGFNFSAAVESREAMQRIDRELRAIQGVRMVL